MSNVTVRISVGFGGAEANDRSSRPIADHDGGQVAFSSNASNLVATDPNGTRRDTFLVSS